jgi:glycosyltransferase involved in cell wall biosynthesis
MPKISVILTVHGVADYLDSCLGSVLGQEGAEADVEFIAVDDASPDRSGAILAARHDPRLTVIRTATASGPGRARELGAKEATGEYLWFVDGDDELADGALAAVVAQLDRLHPDVLNVDYENIFDDGTITPSGTDLAVPELTTLADSPVLLWVTMSMWNKVFRRDFLSDVGVPFGPGIYEEVPVATAALLTSTRIGVLNRVCYRYRRSRRGSFMATINDLHFDIFTTYETIWDFVSERFMASRPGTPSVPGAEAARTGPAYPLTTAVRDGVFERTIRHYAFALPKVPRSRRRDFFRQMTRDFRRWRPEGFNVPPGLRGIELRLVGRGAYRMYSVLVPLNRFRLALRRRYR